ncbi:MAG: hypothetical protein AVDCRST_MAG73-519 [uncultured Thermomicrobiales bacterium]|uniref:TIR domain-containing protein n=1 Tax=uncultured Thermomicrobiales bacterium TaxID=1645740 RepID=A0A6J4TP22_9BACT|nr:MAG: hypothetical protein AVDCRST_MAG73-519 [uncultured Thermomicrobiales bacterium]
MDAAPPRVFVSYASGDRDQARSVVAVLERVGVRAWIDVAGIAGGQSYGPEIVAAIRGCAALVLLCSEASLASRNVRQEVALAWKHGRLILPLLLEPAVIPDELAYWLEAAQWVEVLDRKEDAWLPEVVRALARSGVAPGPLAPSLAIPPEHPPLAHAVAWLPTPLTALLGRDAEVAELVGLLATHRLVTLTGPGGVGKTRLAVEVARVAAAGFPDGVAFVDLSPVRDPDLVLPAAAHVLGVREAPDVPVPEALAAAIGDRRTLLVLDNLEQVIEAAPAIAALLAACPHLAVLATSRAPLAVRGERVLPVEPFPVQAAAASLGVLAASPAARLFAERAAAVKPGFALTEDNLPAVAAICSRLDGLPLAIELAAARVKLLTPEALLARLDGRLPLLTSGPRDLPDRQRTLRGAIAWSHDLLSAKEQVLFRRLAVFAGGWTPEAAEGAANPDGALDIWAELAGLVDHSLVRQEEGSGGARFRMLETIREFALERLELSGEAASFRDAHAAHYLALTQEARNETSGPEQGRWLDRLEAELGNLRAALAWATERADALTALGLANSLEKLWDARGLLREGRHWLERASALPMDGVRPETRAQALSNAGSVAQALGDLEGARVLQERALTILRELDSEGGGRGTAHVLNRLGIVALLRGDHGRADALQEEALARFRELGDASDVATVLNNLGVTADDRGDFARARRLFEDALALQRDVGDTQAVAISLGNLGEVARDEGDLAGAAIYYREALALWAELKDRWNAATALDGAAGLAVLQGKPEGAARLAAAAEAMREAVGAPLPANERADHERCVAEARSALGAEAFAAAWEAGRALPLEAAVAEALAATGDA